jgi:hypothetical protein
LNCRQLRELGLSTGGYEIESEILIKSARKGIKILSVPVKTIYGDEISKIRPMRDTLKFIKYFFKAAFLRNGHS